MAHQWRGTLIGITRSGAGFTGGVTGNTTYTFGSALFANKSTTDLWDGAMFGVSVTTFNGVNFSCYVVGTLGGITVPIAGISGIGSTTTALLPIVNELSVGVAAGTTQNAVVGIPTPTAVIFGNSGIVGKSYSAVVYGVLSRSR